MFLVRIHSFVLMCHFLSQVLFLNSIHCFFIFRTVFLYFLLIFPIPKLFFFQEYFFLWWLHCFIVLFFSMINHQFFSFCFVNYFTWTWSKQFSVLPRSIIFLLYFSNGINMWSCSIYVFSVLNTGCVSFIIKQEGIHIFWSLWSSKESIELQHNLD